MVSRNLLTSRCLGLNPMDSSECKNPERKSRSEFRVWGFRFGKEPQAENSVPCVKIHQTFHVLVIAIKHVIVSNQAESSSSRKTT